MLVGLSEYDVTDPESSTIKLVRAKHNQKSVLGAKAPALQPGVRLQIYLLQF